MYEQELSKLVKRLEEANISTQIFLKIRENKAAIERGFQNKLYNPKDFQTVCDCMICGGTRSHSAWGIMSKDGLVLVDTDKAEMYQNLSKVLPETFEVTSPRRGLPHKYFIVTGKKVKNAVLQLPNDKDSKGKSTGAGEIRANNQYLVAPGTETQYGTYTVTKDVPIAKVPYEQFMEAVKPYLDNNCKNSLTIEDMIKGVGEGKRHEMGMKYATRLIRFEHYDTTTALHILEDWNKRNNPPMSQDDLKRMVEKALQYGSSDLHIDVHCSGKYPSYSDFFKSTTLSDGRVIPPRFNAPTISNWIASNLNFKYDAKKGVLYYGDKKTQRWTTDGDIALKCIVTDMLGKEDSESRYKAILYTLKNLVTTEIQLSKKIACANGLLDVEKNDLSPFNLEEMTLFSIPTAYDQNAICQIFLEWLNDVQPNQKSQMLIQEWSGFCLLTDYRFHKSLWNCGVGRNGKSTWIATIIRILGRHNVSTVPLEDFNGDNRFALTQLYGKLLNISSEPATKHAMETPNFKKVTGQDLISGERKGIDERLEFVNVAKITIMGNHFPKVGDNSLAFKDRLMFLKWTKEYTGNKQVANIEERWANESSGILNWMLDGLSRLLKNGHFTQAETSDEAMLEYLRLSDNVSAFIKETIKFGRGEEIVKADLYNKYLEYCDALGLEELSYTKFNRRMLDTNKIKEKIAWKNGSAARVWLGIAKVLSPYNITKNELFSSNILPISNFSRNENTKNCKVVMKQ